LLFFRALLPHYTCGFFVENGEIVDAAPIMAWAIGKSLLVFERWAWRKGGAVELLQPSRKETY